MWKSKLKTVVFAGAVTMAAIQFSSIVALSQSLPALDCEELSDTHSKFDGYMKKFRKSFLNQRSLSEMSSMVNFFDISINDCDAVIVIALTPKENMSGEKEAWIFETEPWRFIGSN